MASLLVVLIILGCAAYQYFKGTLVKAIATLIITICASVVAFGYFEILANVFISRADNSRFLSLVPWAQPLSFALLFILAFAGMQTVASLLTRQSIDLGFLPERIGRVICGIFLGLMLSGVLLTGLEMAPLPITYPYQRFDQKFRKVLLNADGFATGLFSITSRGSFSGKRSFATLHADYLDQLYLNRLLISSDIPIITSSQAIELPKKAVWPASEEIRKRVDDLVSELNRRGKLVDEITGEPVLVPGWLGSDYEPTIVRVGIKKSAVKTDSAIDGGTFTLTQLRLICKPKGYAKDPLAGRGKNVYPIGYLKAADQIQVSYGVKIQRDDFERNATVKLIDFVFCLPSGFEPVLVEFKLNSIVQIPRSAIVSADQAPPAAVFIQSPKSKEDTAKPGKPSGQRTAKPPRQSTTPSKRRGLRDIGRSFMDDEFE